MAKFNQEEFNLYVVENDVIGIQQKPFKLVSCRESRWYINWRKPTADAFLLDKLTDYVVAFAHDKGLNTDCFYGVPEGPTKAAVIATHKLAKQSSNYGPGSHVVPMGRGKPKEHGDPKDRYFLGVPQGSTTVIEDVTTTGTSLMKALDPLLEVGANVTAAIGLSNRMEKRPEDGLSVEQAIQQKYNGRVAYFAMSNAIDLLPLVVAKRNTPDDLVRLVEQEFAECGVQPLKLR